jgi:OTU domain-containing protein 6
MVFDMEELLAKHRKEKKDLQARVMQKKKTATKRTRKGVNDECERLERELKERLETEIAALNGDATGEIAGLYAESADDAGDAPTGEAPAAHNVPVGQLDAKDLETDMSSLSMSTDDPSHAGKKPNRQKARLARRAAQQTRIAEEAEKEAAAMPDLKTQEKAVMDEAFKTRGLEEKTVRADGHCLYAAVADQLRVRGDDVRIATTAPAEDDYRVVRHVAADYISSNTDDFTPFLEEDLTSYVTKVRNTGEWGGQIELMALSKAYSSKICVLQGDGSVTEIGEGPDDKTMWLAFYRHNFGLGEHYNSLRSSAAKGP